MKSCRVSGAGLSQVAALAVFGGVVLPEHQGEAMRPEQRAGTRGRRPFPLLRVMDHGVRVIGHGVRVFPQVCTGLNTACI